MKINDIEYALEYNTFTPDEKDAVLDKLIDMCLKLIEDALMFYPEINRVDFLIKNLNETLQAQEVEENYECCALIKDIIERIDAA